MTTQRSEPLKEKCISREKRACHATQGRFWSAGRSRNEGKASVRALFPEKSKAGQGRQFRIGWFE